MTKRRQRNGSGMIKKMEHLLYCHRCVAYAVLLKCKIVSNTPFSCDLLWWKYISYFLISGICCKFRFSPKKKTSNWFLVVHIQTEEYLSYYYYFFNHSISCVVLKKVGFVNHGVEKLHLSSCICRGCAFTFKLILLCLRDTTVQTLTVQPSVQNGIITYEDSPLVSLSLFLSLIVSLCLAWI